MDETDHAPEPGRLIPSPYSEGDLPPAPRASFWREPDVSILTAATHPELLEDTYRSLRAQDCNWEWLVQLDGEAAGRSKDILHAKFLADPRVRVKANPLTMHLAGTRNLAMERAEGRYLFGLDAADQIFPGAIDRLLGALEEEPECFAAFGRGFSFTGGDPSNAFLSNQWLQYGVIEPGTFCRQFEDDHELQIAPGGVLWRRDSLIAAGGYRGIYRAIGTSPFLACDLFSPSLSVDVDVYLHDTSMDPGLGMGWQAERGRYDDMVLARIEALRRLSQRPRRVPELPED